MTQNEKEALYNWSGDNKPATLFFSPRSSYGFFFSTFYAPSVVSYDAPTTLKRREIERHDSLPPSHSLLDGVNCSICARERERERERRILSRLMDLVECRSASISHSHGKLGCETNIVSHCPRFSPSLSLRRALLFWELNRNLSRRHCVTATLPDK